MKKPFSASFWIMLTAHILVLVLMAALLFGSAGFRNEGARVENVTYVTSMLASVDGGPETMVQLPHSFTGLEPRTKVTLRTTIIPKPDDTVYVKSVYAPAKIYLDGEFRFEYGKRENYPSYMLDPAIELHMTETYGSNQPMELKMEFLSPVSRDSLVIHPPIVGNSKEVTLERCHYYGVALVLASAQIIYGISLLLISVCLMLVDRKGQSFLWLGLMALMSGVWMFGENNFSGFMFKNSTFLYLMTFIGLFTFIIPLLRFTRFTVDFENPRPLWLMELIAAISAGIALLLQFLGIMQCSESLYYFHIMLPVMLVLLTFLVCRETVRYHNTNAKRFILPIAVLTLMAVLELLNYRVHVTYLYTSVVQIGILFFLLVMGVTAGLAVKESVSLRSREKELHFQRNMMDIQLKEQASRSQILSQHEQMLSRQRHDLRHHLNALMELAGDNEPLKEYVRSLGEVIPQASRTFCENRTVNAVLAHYSSVCSQKEIRLTMQLVVPAETEHVDNSKLCVVFGNLLENAVEACDRMTEGEKYISLDSRLQNGILTIAMENSFNGQVRKDGEKFISSKRDDYGIGLASVRSVAREAQGEARFEGDGKIFRSRVYFRI